MSTSDEGAEAHDNLIQEIAFIAPDAETTCHICNAEFLDSQDLDIHISQVHNEGSVCQFCHTTYTDLVSYANHIANTHLLELKCCRFCTKAFTESDKAKAHEKRHRPRNKLYSCSQCSLLLSSLKDVEVHEFIHHDNNIDGVFVKCMVYLSSLLSLNALALLQSNERVFICIKCGFTSFDVTTYLQHLKENKCRVYLCDTCGAIFKLRKTLIKHVLRTRKCLSLLDFSNLSQQCSDCHLMISRSYLKEHQKSCKAYRCYICDIVFSTIDGLSNHQSQVHPSELELVKCKFCQKEFSGDHTMNKHIERSHKPTFHQYKYQCKKCDAIFKHPQNLFGHYFSKHKDFEPYTCRVCDKKFKLRKRFTIHIKLDHKSIGFVEFDDQYNVFFTDKKSENPFIPKCVIPELLQDNASSSKAAETDITETETEAEAKPPQPKKKRCRRVKSEIVNLSSSDEEDVEPLLIIKKRAERKKFHTRFSKLPKHMKVDMLKRNRLTCKICNKYCYTYQFYHNHMKTHSKHESIECIKCLKSFPSKKELNEHIAADHTSSKLIETLKSVLERKQGETQNNANNTSNNTNNYNTDTDEQYPETDLTQRFLRTIKKVKIDKALTSATISRSGDNLSAKKFIENFVPDDGKEGKQESVVIKRYASPYYRPETIKLRKFTPETIPNEIKLKMPERFKADKKVDIKASIRIVHMPEKRSVFEHEDDPERGNEFESNFQDYDDYEYNRNDTIPEVAQEVMLEETEEPPKKVEHQPPHKIVIPKLPQGYKNIHIATLQPQAPFYKIIKIKGAMNEPIVIDTSVNETKKGNTEMETQQDDVIHLPDGTKLVTANPLAHLLGDKPVGELLKPSRHKQYYKPAITNYKGKLAEALSQLDKPKYPKRKPKKKAEI